MPNPQGWFVWHELSTTDPAAAESFYTQVAPWSVRSSELSNTYRMIEAGGAPLGGIVAVDPAQADRAGVVLEAHMLEGDRGALPARRRQVDRVVRVRDLRPDIA